MQKSILSFYHVGPQYLTQGLRVGGKHFYPQSILAALVSAVYALTYKYAFGSGGR